MKRARFGEFEADLAAGELRRGTTRQRLARQPAELLTALLERPGEVVTREELRGRLWREDTFVDFEHGLNAAVNRLREALGDSAQDPRFVETLPGRGYRFLAPVEIPPEAGPLEIAVGRAPPPGPGPLQAIVESRSTARAAARRRLTWAVAVVAGVVGTAVWLVGRPKRRSDEIIRFAVTLPPATSLDASPVGTSIAVSPNGRQVAFVAGEAGRPLRLWIRSLDDLSAQPLDETENGSSPFWSPDGRFLAFFAEGRLRKASVHGGPAETLSETEYGCSGSWSADGTILFSEFAGRKAGLWRVSSAGGLATRVPTDAGGTESWPHFLPDGRHFLFLTGAYGGEGAENVLHVASLESPRARRLLSTDSRATYVDGGRLVFVRDGVLMSVHFDADRMTVRGEAVLPLNEAVSYLKTTATAQYSASADGRALAYIPVAPPTQLTWLDRTGRSRGTVGEPALLSGVRLSPDGTRVALHVFDLRKGARDVWIDDLERGTRSRLTTDPRDALSPIWDPRGPRIIFSSARRGPPQLYARRAEAGGDEQLVLDARFVQLARDWSPDGTRIALEDFSAGRRASRQIWLATLGPPVRLTPFEHGSVNKYDPRFSPDGLWLAFTSEETGRSEVFLASLDGASRRQVSSEGGALPRWRRDGRELFFLTPDGRLVAVTVEPGPRITVGVGQTLFAVAARSAVISSLLQGPDYDVAADGQRFLFNLGAASPGPRSIVVLLGWQRGLMP